MSLELHMELLLSCRSCCNQQDAQHFAQVQKQAAFCISLPDSLPLSTTATPPESGTDAWILLCCTWSFCASAACPATVSFKRCAFLSAARYMDYTAAVTWVRRLLPALLHEDGTAEDCLCHVGLVEWRWQASSCTTPQLSIRGWQLL